MDYRRESEDSDRIHTRTEPERGVSLHSNDHRPVGTSGHPLVGANTVPGSPRRSDGEDNRARRSAQACLRCRKKKLRCTGGCPCAKCDRAQEKCDFGKKSEQDSYFQPTEIAAAVAVTRIAQLERTVADLLSDLTTVRDGDVSTIDNAVANASSMMVPAYPTVNWATSSSGNSSNISPPFLFGNATQGSTSGDSLPSYPPLSVKSAAIINPNPSGPNIGPRTVRFGPSPTESQTRDSVTRKDRESPHSRLAVASLVGEGFRAPFQALTYHPGVWENREQSRGCSPRPDVQSMDESWPAFEAKAGPRDDPMTLGMLESGQAETLFDFFFTKCHHFLPILAACDTEQNGFHDIRGRCSYLFSTIIAIGSKFYLRHCRRHGISTTISSTTPAALARLSYSHLAASLFRKRHQLADVQATLLLAGWGLQSGGGGPDPWLVTGHCARLAQRLGLHQLGPLPPSPSPEAAEKYMHRSRTWLGWYHFDGFLSLGFGRPQSLGIGSISEHSFLQLGSSGQNGTHIRSDMYIASMVQLTQIGRDLISWIPLLTDCPADNNDARLTKEGNDHSIGAMLSELNKRLDDWTTRWTWNGSLSAIKLGKSGRLAKLQSEHVRLCLNSLALKPGLLETDNSALTPSMASYVQKATEAAINTIQAHSDAVDEDDYLSYSVDYITIALGQAAVFLVRLHSRPSSIPIDRAVIAHYLRKAIELLEDTDLSETRNSTYVGRVCRDLSGVAGIDIPTRIREESPSQLQHWNDAGLPLIDDSSELDLASFLQFDNSGMDLGILFGLPTDALNARGSDERLP